MRLEKESGQIVQNIIDHHKYFYFERDLELARAFEHGNSMS